MAFYQREKVNPLGSCLPLILQIPFFLALFQLLRSPDFKADIADNPGFYAIDDLADKVTDPVLLGVLIVLYVGTQLAASLVTAVRARPHAAPHHACAAVPVRRLHRQLRLRPHRLLDHDERLGIGQQLLVKKLPPKPVPAGATADAGPAPPRAGKPPAAKPAGAAALTDGEPEADGKPSKAPSGTKKQRKGKQKAAATTAGNGGSSKPPPSPSRRRQSRAAGQDAHPIRSRRRTRPDATRCVRGVRAR